MECHRAEGGLICVVSHSHEHNILRDYEHNGLPVPDAVYGWGRPEHERKPHPFPLLDIMERFGLDAKDMLMIDDLKPGYDMALAAGVDFAAVGWAGDIKVIEDFMRKNSRFYFKTVEELDAFLAE
jgi:phosphoglycolate phosphatase/pyrophosphatase PpaX